MTGKPLSGIVVAQAVEGWAGSLLGSLLVELGASVYTVPISTSANPSDRSAQQLLVEHGLSPNTAAMPPARLAEVAAAADLVLCDELGRAVLAEAGVGVGAKQIWCEIVSDADAPSCHPASPLCDLILQAASGVLDTTGAPDADPVRVGTDISAGVGALFGAVAVLAALFERTRSGAGQTVTVCLTDALTVATTNFVSRVFAGIPDFRRLGNQGPNTSPWNLFPTAGGDYIYIAAGNDATFNRLCQAMGAHHMVADPDFGTEERRRINGARINAAVTAWTSRYPAPEISELLHRSGVPCSQVHSLAEIIAAAQDDPTAATPFALQSKNDRMPTSEASAANLDHAAAAVDRPPLDGVRVVEIGIQTAGPYCARILADLGADVVKIEPPEGEQGRRVPPFLNGSSVYFDLTNAGKRLQVADLREPQGVVQANAAIATADAVVTNLSATSLTRHGLELAQRDAVVTLISGFGNGPASAERKAYDTVVQAASGMMAVTGYPHGTPMKAGISAADFMGALAAAAATIAGLIGASRGERYEPIDLSLLQVTRWSTRPAWVPLLAGRPENGPNGNRHWNLPLHDVYHARDGLVAVVAPDQISTEALLATAANTTPTATTPTATAHPTNGIAEEEIAPGAVVIADAVVEDELTGRMSAWCAQHSVAEVAAAARQCGAQASAVHTVADHAANPDLRRRRLIRTVPRPGGGTVDITGMPFRFSRSPLADQGGAPALESESDSADQTRTPASRPQSPPAAPTTTVI